MMMSVAENHCFAVHNKHVVNKEDLIELNDVAITSAGVLFF